jgi:WD40 repeat protein
MGRALDKALELGLTGLESLLQRRDLLPAVARGHCCQTDQTDKWRRNFPDERIVSGSGDRTVRLWDATTGLQRHVMGGHTDHVITAVFLRDGRSILSSSYDRTVRLWDAETGAERRIFNLENLGFLPLSFAFPPDGRIIACGLAQLSIQVLHTLDGTELGDQHHVLPGHEGRVQSVAFSSDGQHVVTSSTTERTVRMWDATTGLQVHVMNGHEDSVCAITFSPNGQRIASASEDGTIRVWDAETGAHVHTMSEHEDTVNAVSFSPDSQFIVSASRDHTVRVWDAVTGHCRHVLTGIENGHSQPVNNVVFSLDGHCIASGSEDNKIQIWDTTSYTQQHVMCGHTDPVWPIAFSLDGRLLVSGSEDNTVRVWDVTTGAQRHVMKGHTKGVYSVRFLYDNNYIVSHSWDGTTRVWITETGEPLKAPWPQQETQDRVDQHPAVTHPLFNINNDGWISRLNMEGVWQRVCWIPPDRQGSLNAWASSGQRVFIGAGSGVITILDFSHVA